MRKVMDRLRIVKTWIFPATILLLLSVPRPVRAQEAELKKKWDRLIKNDRTAGRKAAYARWSGVNKRIYGHNLDQPMVPASCLKILSTGVVLRHMGASYKFTSSLLGEIKGDALTTPLYWRGNGDPSMTLDNLTALVRQLKAKGVRKIPKGVVIDDTYFDRQKPAGFQFSRGNEGFLALPTPTTVEGNAITVTLEIKDAEVAITCLPASPYHTCSSEVTVGTKEDVRFTTDTRGDVLQIKAKGTITAADPKVVNRVRSFDSSRYAHGILLQVLKENGITVDETFARGATPAKVPVIVSHSSDTLAALVRATNRHSNNFYAENLLKALGAQITGQPGTTQKGLDAVYAFLTRAGVKRNQVVLANGSGLFGNSKISARALASAMEQYATLPWLQALMIDSLPRPGRDGTLYKRFTGTAAEDVVYAKTGTLGDASCLAGYISKGNRTILFAIMQDGIGGDLKGARTLQDELVVSLAKFFKGQKP
ncbi:D-alanyl-D-alanine carboxypeptidase/D-alanyl-D-alanine-endopeptidase [Myxococcota bacterium]|nr:D-alanyl-D-alanine carboxypeptidase/D-alanyl-D-alanine-endopeptidase [Myxococcota bacterium]MBU1411578.1 D-alanyl-D-alanine carboxypeptidase/D-alanyl-D-alanine-endopeptidase [Myxococcota bacterium]MBU1509098.1 D-alanyl-D-alanine carboxypeptidase/D-alanyl-D-alanine-endopeptidase [Myxococcota bacterium]